MRIAASTCGANTSDTDILDENGEFFPFIVVEGTPDPQSGILQIPLRDAVGLYWRTKQIGFATSGSVTANSLGVDRSFSWDITDKVMASIAASEQELIADTSDPTPTKVIQLVASDISGAITQSWSGGGAVTASGTLTIGVWGADLGSGNPYSVIWFRDEDDNLLYVPPLYIALTIFIENELSQNVLMQIGTTLITPSDTAPVDFDAFPEFSTGAETTGTGVAITAKDYGTLNFTSSQFWEYRDEDDTDPIYNASTGAFVPPYDISNYPKGL